MVTATDASLSGWGVAVANWDITSVKAVGRVKERRRFRDCTRGARASAMAAAGLEADEESAEGWRWAEAGAVHPKGAFPEVPAALLAEGLWRPTADGVWERDENIFQLESRAVLYGAERVALTTHGAMKRVL